MTPLWLIASDLSLCSWLSCFYISRCVGNWLHFSVSFSCKQTPPRCGTVLRLLTGSPAAVCSHLSPERIMENKTTRSSGCFTPYNRHLLGKGRFGCFADWQFVVQREALRYVSLRYLLYMNIVWPSMYAKVLIFYINMLI